MDVQIKIDGAGAAVAAADKVTTALGKTEDAGPAAGDAISKGMAAAQRALGNLANGFRGLEQTMNARARATQIHTQLNNHLANSFAGVAAQIAHEKRILDSIHGPMQRYEQDVRALDALHARGAISANQHAAALAKSRAAAGMGNPMSAVSLTMPQAKAKSGAGTGTSLMNMGMGAVAGAMGAREVLQMADSYTGLENRMRQVSSTHDELQRNMARISQIAKATRSDIGSTGESFVRLHMATRQLGVSQERAFKITETLNMALQSSGASSSEAAAGTLQLMQALGAGALQGDEFRSVAENMPILLDVLSKQLGVSRGELKKMGAEGKITTDIMIKALEAFGPQAKKTFEESEQTFAQFATGLKNAATEFAGSGMSVNKMLNEQVGLKQKLRLEHLAETAAREKGNFSLQGQIENNLALAGTYGTLSAEQAKHVLKSIESIDVGFRMAQMLKQQLEHMEKLRKEVQRLASIDPWGDSRSGWTKLVDRLETRAGMAVDAFSKHIDKVTKSAKEAHAELEKLAEPYARMIRSPVTMGDIPGFDKHGGNDAYSRYVDAEVERLSQMPDPNLEGDLAAHMGGKNPWAAADERAKAGEAYHKHLDDLRMKQLEDEEKKILETQRIMSEGFANIMEDMAQSAFDAKADINDMMKRIWMGMFRLMSQQAMGSAFGGGSLPGFAYGGSFEVGGHGSTDTTPVAFMATPGERVTVETPGQQSDSGSGSGARHINIHLGERDVLQALDTPEGERLIVRVLKKTKGTAVRGYTSGA